MPAVVFSPFSGTAPRHARSLEGKHFAEVAHDVDLSDGTLRPWREPAPVAATETNNGYYCGCDFIDLEECEQAHLFNTPCPTVVISGGSNQASAGPCDGIKCPVHFPCPNNVLTLAHTPSDIDEDTDATHYVYTYVNASGNESAPSYPSLEIQKKANESVTVSGFETPADLTCTPEIIIYRHVTGFRTGTEGVREEIHGYRRVAVVPSDSLVFQDTIRDANLGPALTTEQRTTAPEDLVEVQPMGELGGLIGHDGTTVYRSVPANHQWWPEDLSTSIGQDITGLVSHTNFAAAFTNQGVYLFNQSSGEEQGCSIPRFIEDVPSPIINRDRRRWVSTRFGIVYVSDEGLILLRPDGQYDDLTGALIGTHLWRQMKPETMRLGFYESNLFFVSDTHGFILNMRTDIQSSELTTISDRPERFLTTVHGDLLLIGDGEVSQWNASGTYRSYKWTKNVYTRSIVFRDLLASTNGLVTVSVNKSELKVSGDYARARRFKYRKSRTHVIEIEAEYELARLAIASSYRELANVDF